MKSKKRFKIMIISLMMICSIVTAPFVFGEHIKTTKPIINSVDNNEPDFFSMAGQLTSNLKVREIGGNWQENSLTVDVGTELEFQVYAKSNRVYILVSVLNVLPEINGNPMFDYVEGSASPDPVAGWVHGDDELVEWGWGSVGLFWSRTMTWRSIVVESGTASVDMTAIGLINLDPGDFHQVLDSVQITGQGQEQPNLIFSPQSHDFGSMEKGEIDSTSFDIWNGGSGTLTYSLSESCNWVSVSPTSGSSTGGHNTIDVDIDTSSLSIGNHQCDISINSNGGNDVFSVYVNVYQDAQPSLSYYPHSHDFGDMIEGEMSFTNFQIWNSGGGTLTYSLSENCNWVIVNPTSGSSTGEYDQISVTIDTTGLSIGLYSCPISISSNDDIGTFTVTVDVVEDQPILSFSPQSYDFGNVLEGEIDSTSFNIWNRGTDVLDYTLTENCDWVTINPTSGSSSGEQDTITINIDTTGLDFDSYTCPITINSNGGSGTFTVTMSVVEEVPILSFNPQSYDFGNMLEDMIDSTSFNIWNSGYGTLNYDLTERCDWVTVHPTSGSSNGEQDTITINIDTTGLEIGESYTCPISINSNGGSGTFTVSVTITDDTEPILLFNPKSHNFGDMNVGEARSTTFEIWNGGSGVLKFELNENCNWVTINPTSGSSSGSNDKTTITVNVDTSDLSIGLYSCPIKIKSDFGYDTFVVIVNVVSGEVPPGKPYDPFPEKGAKNVPLDTVLRWSCDGEAPILYNVYLEAWDSTPGKLVSYNKLDKNHDPGGLLPDTHYYWKVVSKSKDGLKEGQVWDFWTGDDHYEISITSPEIGVLQYRSLSLSSILLSLFKMSLVIDSSLLVEADVVGNIDKVRFVVTNAEYDADCWDDTPEDGFSCEFNNLPKRMYKIIVYAYNGDMSVASDKLSNIFFIKQ